MPLNKIDLVEFNPALLKKYNKLEKNLHEKETIMYIYFFLCVKFFVCFPSRVLALRNFLSVIYYFICHLIRLTLRCVSRDHKP